jgi:hypothetical protein
MDPQQLLATLIQLSDEQQKRIAELLNRLEQQTRTLTTASQRAVQAANALDHNGQKTALHGVWGSTEQKTGVSTYQCLP